jgi:hypothetical protein
LKFFEKSLFKKRFLCVFQQKAFLKKNIFKKTFLKKRFSFNAIGRAPDLALVQEGQCELPQHPFVTSADGCIVADVVKMYCL